MEITALNQQRRLLLQELHTLRNYREYCINQTQQKMAEIKLEYAEKYFTLDGDYAGRSFQDRFATSVEELVNDVHENEDILGVRLDDLDEEIDHVFRKLSKKEQEFEELEKEIRKPWKEKEEFRRITDSFVKDAPDLHNPLDYVELQEIIERKELFEQLLQDIVQERESQIQQEIQKIQEEYQQNRIDQKIVYFNLEQHAASINSTLKGKHIETYDRINKEKERLFEEFLIQEKERHRRYGLQYQQIYDERQQTTPEMMQQELEASWKYHLFQNQDQLFEKERRFREEQKQLDALLLQYLSRRDYIHHSNASLTSLLNHSSRTQPYAPNRNPHMIVENAGYK